MAEASKTTRKKLPAKSDAKTEEFATQAFAKSGYPKTVKENIKVILNLFVTFLS